MNLLAQVELSGTGSSRLRYRVGGRETAGGPDRCLKDPDSCGVGKAAGKVAFGSDRASIQLATCYRRPPFRGCTRSFGTSQAYPGDSAQGLL